MHFGQTGGSLLRRPVELPGPGGSKASAVALGRWTQKPSISVLRLLSLSFTDRRTVSRGYSNVMLTRCLGVPGGTVGEAWAQFNGSDANGIHSSL